MREPMGSAPFEDLLLREVRGYSELGVRAFDAGTISSRARSASGIRRPGLPLLGGSWLRGVHLSRLPIVLALLALGAVLAFLGAQLWHRLPAPGLLSVGGQDQILIVDRATGAVQSITPRLGHDAYPVWSPDGRRVAFSQHDGRGPIKVVDADGGNLQVIGTGMGSSEAVSWSPDGTRIAFIGYRYPGDSQPGLDEGGLYLAALDGSAPRLLIPGTPSRPTWSPDGTTIAFIQAVGNDDRPVAFVVDVASGRRTQVGVAPVTGPVTWAPDGSGLAYTRLPGPDAAGDGTGGIVVARLLAGAWTDALVIQDEPVLTSTGYVVNVRAMRSPIWLATGLLVYLRDQQPWLATPAGTDRRQLSEVTASPYGVGCVAPDGSALVLPVGAETPTELVIIDLQRDRPDIRLQIETWSYDGPSCSWQATPR